MAGIKGFNTLVSVGRDRTPEELLILAVYIRARNDLFGRSRKWREDAELFFEADGLDPKRIRGWYTTGVLRAQPQT